VLDGEDVALKRDDIHWHRAQVQGLTLVHVLAEPELFLTKNTP